MDDLTLTFALPSASHTLTFSSEAPISALIARLTAATGIPAPELRVYTPEDAVLTLLPSEPISSLRLAPFSTLKVRQSRAASGGGASASASAPAPAPGAFKRLRLNALGLGAGARAGPPPIPEDLYPSLTLDSLPPGVSPAQLHAILRANPGMRAELEGGGDAELAAAAREPTAEALTRCMQLRALDAALKAEREAARAKDMEQRLLHNPSDPEAQAFLEEQIRRANVSENHSLAHEHMPEVFTRQPMLIIRLKVNGCATRAMVDTGAQMTIISAKTAVACGIMRLVDTRYAGMAKGVGTGVILGRVHMTPLVLGGQHFSASFSVMQKADMDFLLGLDFLRRFGAVVDVGKGVLRLSVGEGRCVEVPFLSEQELEGVRGSGAEYESPRAGEGGEGAGAGGEGFGAQGRGSGASGGGGGGEVIDLTGEDGAGSSGGAAPSAAAGGARGAQQQQPSAAPAPLFDLSSLL